MRLNYRGLGVWLSRPATDFYGMEERTFGINFGQFPIPSTIGFVLKLGWINVGFRFWPLTPKRMSDEERMKWAERLAEESVHAGWACKNILPRPWKCCRTVI